MIGTNMALLAVAADKAVVETTPHLAHLSVKPLWGSLIWLQTNRTPTERTEYWIVTKKERCCRKVAFKYDFMQKSISKMNALDHLKSAFIYFCNIYLLIRWALVTCEAFFHHLHHKWLLCLQIKIAQYTELNVSVCL